MKSILAQLTLILSLLILSITSYGKNEVTITVVEKETGSPIPYAIVSIKSGEIARPIGMTDINGKFILALKESDQVLKVTSLGFSPCHFICTNKLNRVTVELEKGIELKSVIITSEKVPLISCGSICLGYNSCGIFRDGRNLIEDTVVENKGKIRSSSALTIYPNPSRGSFKINSGLENYILEIFDCTGKIVVIIQNANDNLTISLNDLKAGVYLTRVTKDSSILTSRLVIN